MYEAILGWSDQQAEPVVDNQSIPSHTSIMKVLEKEAWDGGGNSVFPSSLYVQKGQCQ